MPEKVVIVGNGPSAVSRNLGNQIDGFDTVVRFNNFVTEGFELKLGARADVWVNCFYQVPWRDPSQFREIILPRNVRDAWGESWKHLQGVRKEVRIARTSNHTIDWLAARGVRRGSAGMLAIAYYIERIPKISIVGFDNFSASRHHYFAGARPSGCPHSGSAEARLIGDLERRGRVVRL